MCYMVTRYNARSIKIGNERTARACDLCKQGEKKERNEAGAHDFIR